MGQDQSQAPARPELTDEQEAFLDGEGDSKRYLDDPDEMHRVFNEHKALYASIMESDDLVVIFEAGPHHFHGCLNPVSDKYPDGKPTASEQARFLQVENDLMTRPLIDGGQLDMLWALYYVSGDRKYADRVASVLQDERTPFIVGMAAKWSYNSHIQMGVLEAPEGWNNYDDIIRDENGAEPDIDEECA